MKFILKSIIATIFLFQLISCVKDHGNYVYKTLSTYTITGIDTFYYKDADKNPLEINPVIHNPDGTLANDSNFTFEWTIYMNNGNNTVTTVIATTKDLTYYPGTDPANPNASGLGSFSCYFRATDKSTGFFIQQLFTMTIGATTNQGWLLLTQKNNGNSRLDMISERAGTKDTVIQDILKLVNSSFPMDAPPRFIDCNYVFVGVPFTGGLTIMLATEQNASLLEFDSLQYSPLYNLNNYSYYPLQYKNLQYSSADFSGIFSENNRLLPFRYDGYSQYIDNPINIYNGSEFHASPYVGLNPNFASTWPSCIVYNLDTHSFLRIPNLADAVSAIDLPTGSLFNFTDTSKNLVFMKYTIYNSGKIGAVLKSTNNNDFYMVRFATSGVQELYKKINFSEITHATQYAFDPTFGYLFYVTDDNKLYEYDPIAETNTLMSDYGNEKVSVMQYPILPNQSYDLENRVFASRLCVCTYNDSDLENSGKMYLYTVSDLHAPLITYKSYSGLGKVVSLAYKYQE